MNMMISKDQSSTLEIIAAAVAIATILALSVLVVVTQQEANAAASTSLSFEQTQTNKCSGFAGCSNTGTITFLPGHGNPGS
jgi:uncharacterized membrane protein